MIESYLYGFLGGLLIGVAAVVLLLLNGQIMGVSGITSKLLSKPTKDYWWRLAFILGLILGGWILQKKLFIPIIIDASPLILICAGLLVGIGTIIGNGCTSGHGICGIARFSKRSIIATIVFMVAGILTVLVKKLVGI